MEFYHHTGLRARVWMSLVFNGFLRDQVLPSMWIRVIWKPVLKPSKTGTETSHYRPISLMCAGFKIYERLLEMQLNSVLPPLHSCQYGFTANASAELMHSALINHVQTSLTTKVVSSGPLPTPLRVGVLALDLQSVFDTVRPWRVF
eukprot:4089994-Amphidinium_carterae.1